LGLEDPRLRGAGRPGAAGVPGELVLFLLDGSGDLVALDLARERAPFLAVGSGGGELEAVALHRAGEVQLIQGAGDLVAVGLQLDPRGAELLAEPDEVDMPLAAHVRRRGEEREAKDN